MKANPATARARFSWHVFVVVAVLHTLSSALLGGLAFTTGMAAFTENVSSEMTFLQLIGWLWTPPQMIALRHPTRYFGLGGLFLITLAWSSIVGLAFGFIIPWLSGTRPEGEHSGTGHGR